MSEENTVPAAQAEATGKGTKKASTWGYLTVHKNRVTDLSNKVESRSGKCFAVKMPQGLELKAQDGTTRDFGQGDIYRYSEPMAATYPPKGVSKATFEANQEQYVTFAIPYGQPIAVQKSFPAGKGAWKKLRSEPLRAKELLALFEQAELANSLAYKEKMSQQAERPHEGTPSLSDKATEATGASLQQATGTPAKENIAR